MMKLLVSGIAIACIVSLSACTTYQDLLQSRARRDAAIRQMDRDPAQAQVELDYAHEQDAENDQSRAQYNPTLVYTPTPSYTLDTSPSRPPAGINVENTQMNSYYQPGPAPIGMGQGVYGYNGTTGQANTTYVPVDPALTPGIDANGYAR